MPTHPPLVQYDRIRDRIQRLVSDPLSRKTRKVTVSRQDNECPVGWQKLMEEIAETPGVSVERMSSDTSCIDWRFFCED